MPVWMERNHMPADFSWSSAPLWSPGRPTIGPERFCRPAVPWARTFTFDASLLTIRSLQGPCLHDGRLPAQQRRVALHDTDTSRPAAARLQGNLRGLNDKWLLLVLLVYCCAFEKCVSVLSEWSKQTVLLVSSWQCSFQKQFPAAVVRALELLSSL